MRSHNRIDILVNNFDKCNPGEPPQVSEKVLYDQTGKDLNFLSSVTSACVSEENQSTRVFTSDFGSADSLEYTSSCRRLMQGLM